MRMSVYFSHTCMHTSLRLRVYYTGPAITVLFSWETGATNAVGYIPHPRTDSTGTDTESTTTRNEQIVTNVLEVLLLSIKSFRAVLCLRFPI